MNISSTNIIQGRISSAGDDNKSNYVFTLELEKKSSSYIRFIGSQKHFSSQLCQ